MSSRSATCATTARKARFFGGLSIFMFSMIGIVLADNLFMMFIFWELVGFSSWLLINHYRHEQEVGVRRFEESVHRESRRRLWFSARHHLRVTSQFGTVNLSELATKVEAGAVVASFIPLLLFCGAVGKSAQLPLQVWLPDAMEGPTPVSALIHAATMVAAGIYMLCRINMLMVPEALTVIMWIGTATALYAALCAIVQSDIKKVLAYSTFSQLGYMVAAFGLGSLATSHDHDGTAHEVVARSGCRRGDVPSDDPRVFQGAHVPRFGFRDPRLSSRAGHLQDGRAVARRCR